MRNKIKALFLVTVLAVSGLAWPGHGSAATGTIYLSPGSSSVQVGNNITLYLRINPGTAVDGAKATLNFDSGMLQALSVDASSSAFTIPLAQSIGGSSVSVERGILGSTVSGDSLIAAVSFKALAGSGSTSVSLSGVNATSSGSYTNPGSSGASVSFTAPAAASAPSGGTSTSGSTKKATGSTAAATSTAVGTTEAAAPVKPPKISASISKLQFNVATIAVVSDVPVQFALNFGTSKSKLDQTTVFTELGTKNKVNLDDKQLIPGTTYYYAVVTKDSAGNATTSSVKSFKTKGYTFSVTVLDSKYKPVANKTVTLHSSPTTAKTDSHGVAAFTDVAPGQHSIEYVVGKSEYTQNVYVANNVATKGGTQIAAAQTAAVIFAGLSEPAASSSLASVGEIFIAIAILLVIILIMTETPLGPAIKNKLSQSGKKLHPAAQP